MGSIVRSITRAPKKVFKGVKKLAKSPLLPIAAGIFGPAALASAGGPFAGAGFLGSMGARAGLSNLIAQALSGESIDPKSAALSGLTSQLGSMASGARDSLMAVDPNVGGETARLAQMSEFKPSMLTQAKNLGIIFFAIFLIGFVTRLTIEPMMPSSSFLKLYKFYLLKSLTN